MQLSPELVTLDAERDETGESLTEQYTGVRQATGALAAGLAPEDCVVQSMPDVSPTKWHLAHTSWFFETFVLTPHLHGYQPLDPGYAFLFNSYYVQAGERHCRAQRGYISRPTVAEVLDYRKHVDAAVHKLIATLQAPKRDRVSELIVLGLNHEQQHQELIVTDIKHVFSVNPLRPVYRERAADRGGTYSPMRWIEFPEQIAWIGWRGPGFSYDNELPRHRQLVHGFELANRPVTNGEYLEFMADGGYTRAELWLSMGWAAVQENQWSEPFYWEKRDGEWFVFTLSGMQPLNPAEPVSHLSYFEADAYARWADARLPTELEWEVAAADSPIHGNFVESGRLQPAPMQSQHGVDLLQLFGDVWEWTASQYVPYPGFKPAAGAIGEYNGKFMCNQFVLRGGSCATPQSHMRTSYRNFFPPEATWQFTGVRLARDL